MNTITRKRYPSDLTDLQWANLEHLFPQGTGKTGRPRTYPLREIVNAALYLARGGCTWRMLPHDFPPWKTVSSYFYTWRDSGVWEQQTGFGVPQVNFLPLRGRLPSDHRPEGPSWRRPTPTTAGCPRPACPSTSSAPSSTPCSRPPSASARAGAPTTTPTVSWGMSCCTAAAA